MMVNVSKTNDIAGSLSSLCRSLTEGSVRSKTLSDIHEIKDGDVVDFLYHPRASVGGRMFVFPIGRNTLKEDVLLKWLDTHRPDIVMAIAKNTDGGMDINAWRPRTTPAQPSEDAGHTFAAKPKATKNGGLPWPKNQPLFPLGFRVAVIDVETVDNYSHIIQIGVQEVIEGKLARTFKKLVRPATDRTNPYCVAPHGITLASVAGAPDFGEILPALIEFVGDAPILAHNRATEFKSILFECDRLGVPMPFGMERFFCTMKMSAAVGLTRTHQIGLRAACGKVGIPADPNERHDALDDAILTAKLYLALLKRKP